MHVQNWRYFWNASAIHSRQLSLATMSHKGAEGEKGGVFRRGHASFDLLDRRVWNHVFFAFLDSHDPNLFRLLSGSLDELLDLVKYWRVFIWTYGRDEQRLCVRMRRQRQGKSDVTTKFIFSCNYFRADFSVYLQAPMAILTTIIFQNSFPRSI